jgi:hypothetical protein
MACPETVRAYQDDKPSIALIPVEYLLHMGNKEHVRLAHGTQAGGSNNTLNNIPFMRCNTDYLTTAAAANSSQSVSHNTLPSHSQTDPTHPPSMC